MHEHGSILLNEKQCNALAQCSEAINNSINAVSAMLNGIKHEHALVLTEKGLGTQLTGRVRCCPACVTQLPMALRELADMYEELATALELPEAQNKTKFGV